MRKRRDVANKSHVLDNRHSMVLGTAQLGMKYGITNCSEKPTREKAVEIVRTAWDGGVRFFDTAQVYGDAEEILGVALADLSDVKIVSKLNPALDVTDFASIRNAVKESLARLCVPQLWGLLLHSQEQLSGDDWSRIGPMMVRLKDEGLVRHLGVSIYDPEWGWKALSIADLDIIQVPFNIVDRRMMTSGLLKEAEHQGKEIFVRSIYLQGLLLSGADKLPHHMFFAKQFLQQWNAFVEAISIDTKELLIGYVRSHAPSARLLIGCLTVEEVRENLKLFQNTSLTENIIEKLGIIASWVEDTRIVDPRRW